ncbi:hypothetical protein DFJ73DRAFT_127666 [Zopfochytrium polystomum]|nr:hypothetical protein DFJ73DRAFT_127666 [Zopfochytrium polystomum]
MSNADHSLPAQTPLPAPPRSLSAQHEPSHPLFLEDLPEVVLRRVLMCVASNVKSLARLSRASKLWSLRTSHDTIWQPMFLARWAAPVSLAKSPNILDRGQAMTINATEADREIEGRSDGGVSVAEVPWKTLFRDRSALASFQRLAKASKLNDKHSSTVRCICIDAYSIVTAADDGVKIWD